MTATPMSRSDTSMTWPEEALGPEPQAECAGELGGYVAGRLAQGRGLFNVLDDDYVQQHRDERFDVLGAIAHDARVLSAMHALEL